MQLRSRRFATDVRLIKSLMKGAKYRKCPAHLAEQIYSVRPIEDSPVRIVVGVTTNGTLNGEHHYFISFASLKTAPSMRRFGQQGVLQFVPPAGASVDGTRERGVWRH